MAEPPTGAPAPTQNDSATGDILPDPLLDSGSFIDANTYHPPDKNGDVKPSEPIRPEPAHSKEEARSPPAAETAAAVGETPASRKRGPEEAAAAIAALMAERPEWLPEGWRMDFKVRTSGVTAGSIDRYYFEPTLGKRFRSKKEVLYFLETGSKRKKRSSSDADAVPSDRVGGRKEKKSKTKSPPATLNFDFRNPPKSVSWVLANESEDKWTPQVSDENVPESTKQEWATVFEHICHS